MRKSVIEELIEVMNSSGADFIDYQLTTDDGIVIQISLTREDCQGVQQ